jgi:hypothetical protein
VQLDPRNFFQMDILSEGGVSQVLKFASTVSNADPIGKVMADLDQPELSGN